MLKSPVSRLIVRALLAGAVAFLTSLQASDGPLTASVLLGAATAGGWAAVEILTPVNRSVGPHS